MLISQKSAYLTWRFGNACLGLALPGPVPSYPVWCSLVQCFIRNLGQPHIFKVKFKGKTSSCIWVNMVFKWLHSSQVIIYPHLKVRENNKELISLNYVAYHVRANCFIFKSKAARLHFLHVFKRRQHKYQGVECNNVTPRASDKYIMNYNTWNSNQNG